jgi:hypothetical protein
VLLLLLGIRAGDALRRRVRRRPGPAASGAWAPENSPPRARPSS